MKRQLTTRRAFIKQSLAVAALGFAGGRLYANDGTIQQPLPRIPNNRILILVELSGGNDALNMVAPINDPTYRKLRPKIALDRSTSHDIGRHNGLDFALHPQCKPLRNAWNDQDLAIVPGVGYPSPNRSHFRSIDIWQSASASDEQISEGWISRILRQCYLPKEQLADALLLGNHGLGPCAPGHGNDAQIRPVIMRDANQFLKQTRNSSDPGNVDGSGALSHILNVQQNIHRAAERLAALRDNKPSLIQQFPKTQLGKSCELASQLIAAGMQVPVIHLALGGFDTHANQAPKHAQLMRRLSEALTAFRGAMKEVQRWDDCLVMTYAEFGRRVKENGSAGTDHGAAASHLIMGGRVTGGQFIGEHPSLNDLHRGDLRFSQDFRGIYQSIVQNWWGLNLQLGPQNLSTPQLLG